MANFNCIVLSKAITLKSIFRAICHAKFMTADRLKLKLVYFFKDPSRKPSLYLTSEKAYHKVKTIKNK